MGRSGRMRLVALAAAAAVVPLVSGCVAFSSFSNLEQIDVIGDKPIERSRLRLRLVAELPQPGFSERRRRWLGHRPDPPRRPGAAAASSLPDSPPPSLTFSESPSYAAELQRLSPAPAEAALAWGPSPRPSDYDTASTGPYAPFTVKPPLPAPARAPTGARSAGPFIRDLTLQRRRAEAVAAAAPAIAARLVWARRCARCSTTTRARPPTPVNICDYASDTSSMSPVRDLGHPEPEPSASCPPGRAREHAVHRAVRRAADLPDHLPPVGVILGPAGGAVRGDARRPSSRSRVVTTTRRGSVSASR